MKTYDIIRAESTLETVVSKLKAIGINDVTLQHLENACRIVNEVRFYKIGTDSVMTTWYSDADLPQKDNDMRAFHDRLFNFIDME